MLLNLVLTVTHLPGFHLLFSTSGFPRSLSVLLNCRWGNWVMGTHSNSIQATQWQTGAEPPPRHTACHVSCLLRGSPQSWAGPVCPHGGRCLQTAARVGWEGLSSLWEGHEGAVGRGHAGEHWGWYVSLHWERRDSNENNWAGSLS